MRGGKYVRIAGDNVEKRNEGKVGRKKKRKGWHAAAWEDTNRTLGQG